MPDRGTEGTGHKVPADHDKLNRTLGSPFANPELLEQAITHRSYRSENNERLEFLGDAILDLVIAEDLYLRFPSATEGQLSRLRAHLVKRETLAAVARDFDLGNFLLLGDGELKSGGFDRDSILADALEAIIGALYLESDLSTVRDTIVDWFSERLEALSLDNTQKDAKTTLQEYLQGRKFRVPDYTVVQETGLAHERIFVVECSVEPLPDPARGSGSSRRIAEQEAAFEALVRLGVVDGDANSE